MEGSRTPIAAGRLTDFAGMQIEGYFGFKKNALYGMSLITATSVSCYLTRCGYSLLAASLCGCMAGTSLALLGWCWLKTQGGGLVGATSRRYVPLVNDHMRSMSPCDYKQDLFNRFQKILDENKLELAYREIFVPADILDIGGSHRKFRNELRKKLLEKLLQIGFFEINILCHLIESSGECGFNNDVYYAMCAKKIYEDTGDAERTYLLISCISEIEKREALLQEYAVKELSDKRTCRESLQMAQKVLSGIQLGGNEPLHLITEYANHPNWEMPIIFVRAINSIINLKYDAEDHRYAIFQSHMAKFYIEENDADTYVDAVSLVKLKRKNEAGSDGYKNKLQRILDEEHRLMLCHNEILKTRTASDRDGCDPEVLCALQKIDGERQSSKAGT